MHVPALYMTGTTADHDQAAVTCPVETLPAHGRQESVRITDVKQLRQRTSAYKSR